MGLDATDDQILALEIIGVSGGLTEHVGIGEEDLMGIHEMRNKILGRGGLDRELADARCLGEGFEPSRSKHVQSTKALGNLVHGSEKFLILTLESRMQLEKIWPFDIPVSQVGLPHEGVGIGQQSLETFDDSVCFLFGSGLSAHVGSFPIVYPFCATCAIHHSPLCL